MRAWLVAVLLVVACKNKSAGPTAASPALNVPKVASASVLAADAPPPFLLLVDEKGDVRVAAAATWAEVATGDLAAKAKTAPLDAIDRFIGETYGLGQPPVRALADWDPKADIDLAALEDKGTNPSGAQDDPPPPPPEDMPDDGADESGGTGTAMALDEGKMGKQDSDRAEGQYKMKHADIPEPAPRRMGMRGPTNRAGLAKLPRGDDATAERLADVVGAVSEKGTFERIEAAIVAPPTLKATKLIELVARMGAAIVVVHDGTVRPLRIDFSLGRDAMYNEPKYWLEARVSAKGVVIEAVPDVPVETSLEPKALAAALDKARTARGAEPSAPVDVLVDADVDAQRLVDVLVALDIAGVRMIGLGGAPTADELKLRGHRTPTLRVGQPNAQGDLDKALIRKVVRDSHAKILACYTKALATKPALTGTVMVQFFIAPTGKVATASASGVDPDVATCVADAIKSLVFPKPKGGGGVQVNYPFTMRP